MSRKRDARDLGSDVPFGLPIPGLPCVWRPGYAIGLLRQTWEWLEGRGARWQAEVLHTASRGAVQPWLAALGVALHPESRISTWRAACPSCGHWAELLRLTDAGGWVCRRCLCVSEAQGYMPVIMRAARYQHMLLLGFYDRDVVRAMRRGLFWAIETSMPRVRTVWDLWWIEAAQVLLAVRPRWLVDRSYGSAPRADGLLWEPVGPWVLEALVNQLVHPTAYAARFRRWQHRAEAAWAA